MAFPVIATTRANGTAVTSSNFTFGAMPTGTTAGDLLVAFGHTIEDNADYTDPSGWTRIDSEPGNSGRSFVWARVATGTDPLVFPLSALANSVSIIVARITGWTGSDVASVEASLLADFSGNGDPPSLTATWGGADNLWLAVCGREGANIAAYPTGYSGGVTGFNDGAWGAVALAYKESASATENPGTGFGTGGATVHVGTIAIRGSSAADTTAPNITGPSGSAGDPTSSKSIAEGTTAVHTFTADEAVTWDLNGGADVSFFAINPATGALTMTARNFEAPVDAGANNTYVVGVRATDGSANAATQTCTVTITNANEAPTFTGTISVPALTEGVAMTPYATAGFYGDPDAGDTAAYSAIGTWPAGVTVNSSTGVIGGTPTTPGTYAGLQVRRTDAGSLTVNSNSFTITVAAAGGVTFTGTVPTKTGTVGTTFDFGSPAMASYFSGSGTYALQSGTLPPGLSVNSGTGAITGTPTTAGSYTGIVVRKTAASGSPATADTNAFTITIAAAPVTPGFDFHTAAGLVFGAISGSLVSLAREVGVSITTRVYDASTGALVATLTPTATDSNGRLPRLTSGSVTAATTYILTFVWPDGSVYSIRMAAT